MAAIRRKRFLREMAGILLGLALALMLGALVPQIREQFSLGIVALWGAAIGGLLASYERFEAAGAALTRRENRWLNYFVGLAVPVALLSLLYLLIR